MGFFNGIKRAFGFSENGDEHDDELDGIDGRAARSPYVNPFKNDKPASEDAHTAPRNEVSAPAQPLGDAEEGIVPISQHRAAKKAAEMKADSQVPEVAPAASVAPKPVASAEATPTALVNDITSLLNTYFAQQGTSGADSPLRTRLKESENQRRALQTRYNTLSERIKELESEAEQAEVEKKALLNKLKVAQMQVDQPSGDAVNQQIDSIAAEYKEKMELTNALLNEIRSEAVRKAKEAEQLRAKLEEVQKSSENSEQLTSELYQKINDLESSLADMKTRHEEAICLKDEEIQRLKASDADSEREQQMMTEMEAMLKEVESFKEKKTNEIETLKHSLEQADEALKQAESTNKSLTTQVAELNRQAADAAEQRRRRDLSLANQINQQKDELKSAKKAIKQISEALEKEKNQHEALTKKCRSLRIENENADAEYQKLQKEYDGAKLVHTEICTEVDALRTEVDALRNELKQAKAQNAELIQANEVLEQTIDELSQQEQSMADLATELILQAEEPIEEAAEAPVASTEPELVAEPEPELIAKAEPKPAPEPIAESEPVAEPIAEKKATEEKSAEIPEQEMEELLDDIDWLEFTPPSNKVQPEPEPEPEPPVKQPNSRQMSLF